MSRSVITMEMCSFPIRHTHTLIYAAMHPWRRTHALTQIHIQQKWASTSTCVFWCLAELYVCVCMCVYVCLCVCECTPPTGLSQLEQRCDPCPHSPYVLNTCPKAVCVCVYVCASVCQGGNDSPLVFDWLEPS